MLGYYKTVKIPFICKNMDESQKHIVEQRMETQRNTYYMILCMESIKIKEDKQNKRLFYDVTRTGL